MTIYIPTVLAILYLPVFMAISLVLTFKFIEIAVIVEEKIRAKLRERGM